MVRPDEELERLMDRFVKVHVTRISQVNHGLFRFDKNLSFAVLFMNADRDMYGRYGTRAGGGFKGPFRPLPDTLQLANKDMSQQGFLRAVDRVLDLHAKWRDERTRAALRELLVPKIGKTYLGRPLRRSVDGRVGRFGRGGRRGGECFHCHRIAEQEISHYFNAGQPVPDRMLWGFPMPDELGVVLDPTECATVQSVARGSEAAQAGLRKDDDILSFAGHPVVSIADVQWALDQAPDAGSVVLQIRRAGQQRELRLALPAGWRRRAEFAWRYSFNGLKARLLGLDELSELDQAERTSAGIATDECAIRIGRVLRARRGAGVNPQARAAGLRAGDIILGVDGRGRQTQSEMLAYILQNKQPGDDIAVRVLRGSERLQFRYPVQRIVQPRGHDH